MKNTFRKQNIIIVLLLSFANLISYSGSFILKGEPKAPKSLLK